MATSFAPWFQTLTGFAPHPWQAALADEPVCRDRILRIPTGFGKTAGAVLPWLHHRVRLDNRQWPTRLVLCLPMRVLVEQAARTIETWCASVSPTPNLHILMGGAADDRWELHPEKPTILVGTQDMLLSRALQRGYAIGRARWPLDFGLLHQDALWILDEVQLMDTGLPTTTQLAAFRQQDARRPQGSLRPCFSWWMSATLQDHWLRTVDHSEAITTLAQDKVFVRPEERVGDLWNIRKSLERRKNVNKPLDVAGLVQEKHQPGQTTLVVVNRVERAVEIFRALEDTQYEGKGAKRKLRADAHELDLRLIHSRFRGAERRTWSEFLQRNPSLPPKGRVIVATQVVEAGVDISAQVLITDVCPWSSLVQRVGRCARYAGERGAVFVVGDSSDSLPYETTQLDAADEAIALLLRDEPADVSPASLEAFEEKLAAQNKEFLEKLYAFTPDHVLRRRDLDDLFDTTPDLTGTDLDVSRYIRSGEERDARVFWRDVPQGTKFKKGEIAPVQRDELCPVAIRALRDFLQKEANKTAYVFDYLEGEWKKADVLRIVPSMNVLLPRECGGYDLRYGWNPKNNESVPLVSSAEEVFDEATLKLALASESEGDDRLSEAATWKTIATHGRETGALAREMGATLHLSERVQHVLQLAGRWHDAGKAHATFQAAIKDDVREKATNLAQRRDLAKAPPNAWKRPAYPDRPGFRHELASTLALFELLRQTHPEHDALLGPHAELLDELGTPADVVPQDARLRNHPLASEIVALSAGEFNLLAWLVCTHHGKVRCRWTSTPHDQETGHGGIFGVVEGDVVPGLSLCTDAGNVETLPDLSLSLDAAMMGVSRRYGASWGERVASLLEEFGPFVLAYLEAILRAADARASQYATEDPLA